MHWFARDWSNYRGANGERATTTTSRSALAHLVLFCFASASLNGRQLKIARLIFPHSDETLHTRDVSRALINNNDSALCILSCLTHDLIIIIDREQSFFTQPETATENRSEKEKRHKDIQENKKKLFILDKVCILHLPGCFICEYKTWSCAFPLEISYCAPYNYRPLHWHTFCEPMIRNDF